MKFFVIFYVLILEVVVSLHILPTASTEGGYFTISLLFRELSLFTSNFQALAVCLQFHTGMLCLPLGKLQVVLSSGF